MTSARATAYFVTPAMKAGDASLLQIAIVKRGLVTFLRVRTPSMPDLVRRFRVLVEVIRVPFELVGGFTAIFRVCTRPVRGLRVRVQLLTAR